MSKTKLTVIVEKTNIGLFAYIKEINGVVGAGSYISELKGNINEALVHHVDHYNETKGESLSASDFVLEYNFI